MTAPIANRLASADDERAVLAGAYRDHSALMLVASRDFSVAAHQTICVAAQRAAFAGRVTRETVRIELERASAPAATIELAAALEREIPDLDGLPAVASRIRELAAARSARDAAARAVTAFDQGMFDDAQEHLAQCSLAGDRGKLVQSFSFGDAMLELVQSWERGPANLCPIGVAIIDQAIGGLERDGSLCVFGARTHVGKSYFALSAVEGLLQRGEKPGVISVEDPKRLWAARGLASSTRIPAERLRRGLVNDREKAESATAAREWCLRDARIVPAVGAHIDVVLAAMAHLVRECGATVLLVDYLQAIASEGRDPRQQTDAKLTAMKSAAARLGVPWILFSQLRRPDEVSKLWTEPHISELKESGEIENRAEAILLGYRKWAGRPLHDDIGLSGCPRCKRFPVDDDDKFCPESPLFVRIAKAKGEPAAGQLEVFNRGAGWLWEPASDEERNEWLRQLDGSREAPKPNGRKSFNGMRVS